MQEFIWSQANLFVFLGSIMLKITELNKTISNTIQFVWGKNDDLPTITLSRYGSNFVTNFILIYAHQLSKDEYEFVVVYATTEQLNSSGVPDPWLTDTSMYSCQPEEIDGKISEMAAFLLDGTLPDGLRYNQR